MGHYSLARSTSALWVQRCEVDGGRPRALWRCEEVESAVVEAYYTVPSCCKLYELVVGGSKTEGEG